MSALKENFRMPASILVFLLSTLQPHVQNLGEELQENNQSVVKLMVILKLVHQSLDSVMSSIVICT